jgi:hypothetical protein
MSNASRFFLGRRRKEMRKADCLPLFILSEESLLCRHFASKKCSFSKPEEGG